MKEEITEAKPEIGRTYSAFGQKDAPFKLLEALNEERREYLMKNMSTGREVIAFDLTAFSDGSIEWEWSNRSGWLHDALWN